ncbi:MAG: SPOR domain-containing protein [Bacteroidetes bacterium]|nr:SPOR domain-containing protein [Bacteroidota bacterium]
MIRSFALLLLIAFSLNLFSQDSLTTNNSHFSVHQDSSITELLSKYKSYNAKKDFVDGYRVQIMYTDIRDEAYRAKAAMYKEFPEIISYVEYEPPYYKLRVGDFRTRLEATYYLQKVITLYTGAFIVQDKIRIK